MFDLAVRNGLVVDGTRSKPFMGSVYLAGEKIASISTEHCLPAKEELNAAGKVIAPGFIDIHSHSDCSFLADPTHEGKLRQGVTFELTGQCGYSPIPLNPGNRADTLSMVGSGFGVEFDESRFTATDFESFAELVGQTRISINQSTLIGHGTLRSYVAGYEMRQLTADELARMCDILDIQLKQGALGLSLGLIYPPGSFCDTGELAALAEVVARYDGILAVHMRSENARLFEAVDEMVDVAMRFGVRLQIAHLKLGGRAQWGAANELLNKLDIARAQGARVHCDQYPYTAANGGLTSCLPIRAMEGGYPRLVERLNNQAEWEEVIKEGLPEIDIRGGADRIVICHTADKYPEIEGMNLSEAADYMGLPLIEAVRQILIRCDGVANCIYHMIDRGDMLKIMARTDIATCSDATSYKLSNLVGKPHPRSTSAFPCFLKTVREENMMPIENAIYKITALPANLMGLGDRLGYLRHGYPGDITVFDAGAIADKATYQEPGLPPVGIDYVLVNGKPVLIKSVITDNRPGRFYRKKGDDIDGSA